ncbi:MAG: hypothetical protein A3K19_23245 [Lentisphaerae bacterium RIFOXYB12_FULL_65_16]|nr:MAG: hypothetical protein A3K18_30855 [Lentisphaerae bacterium RIFOXYA12_64_32]OGV90290.1 MAG: hypothetical protein A3K19_23245 [Lentisphaerae bacterium RIFOXYB12_FULL_65_16]
MGEKLLDAGIISQTQLDLALREQRRTGQYLGAVLTGLGIVDEGILATFLANEVETGAVDVTRTYVSPDVLERVPHELAKQCRAIPLEFSTDRTRLKVAMADPFDVMAIERLRQAAGMPIEVLSASSQDITDVIAQHYQERRTLQATIEELMKTGRAENLDEVVSDPPLIRLVDLLISRAVELQASDIHVEPEEKVLRVRLRVDGILHQEILVPKDLQPAITARLKILGNLNLTEQRVPQDGRATFKMGRHGVNLRVSTLPTSFGENVVLRLLDRSTTSLDLKALGLAPHDLEQFEKVLTRPYGVILVTGPTGSGKTTTLYAALNRVCSLEKSIFTLEDPIEYRLPIIRQTQIHEEIGMTFAVGLRALLRQDPDIILVGETRDSETAEMMMRAALTGHLVFSTLHTNNAVGAIPRLLNMGVECYLLPAVLEAIIAQRLVRTICAECREEGEPTVEAFRALNLNVPPGAPPRLWRGRGCPACGGTGYKGRTAIFEVLLTSDAFMKEVLNKASPEHLTALARQNGMTTMFEDGVRKALEGKTTLAEVLRVTRRSERTE